MGGREKEYGGLVFYPTDVDRYGTTRATVVSIIPACGSARRVFTS